MRANRFFRFLDRYIGIPLCLILSLPCKIFNRGLSLESKVSSILIIKLSAIGDTILLIPTIRALREAYPEAKIGMVVTSINNAIIEDCPYIDESFLLDIIGSIKNPLIFLRFIKRLRRERFKLAIDFDQWQRISSLIAYLSGARDRYGFKTASQHKHYLFTKTVPHKRGRHELLSFLDLIRPLGIEREDPYLEFWTKGESPSKDRFLIAIHPGCAPHGHLREWDKERYAHLADYLIDEYKARIVLTGSKDEVRLSKEIALLMKNKPMILAGKTSISQLASLLKECRLLISGNCGVMHMAAALGTPVIALHGPTDHLKWGPWGSKHIVIRKDLSCSPCLYLGFEYGCKRHTCMDLITLEDVLMAIKEIMPRIV